MIDLPLDCKGVTDQSQILIISDAMRLGGDRLKYPAFYKFFALASGPTDANVLGLFFGLSHPGWSQIPQIS